MDKVVPQVDSRYLIHSERFFFNSSISIASIMNRIYLFIIGCILLLGDVSIYESVNDYTFSFSGFYMDKDLLDFCAYGISMYIIYIFISHIIEYFVKFISLYMFTFFKKVLDRNILLSLFIKYDIYKHYSNVLKYNNLKVLFYLFMLICFSYYVVSSVLYTDIYILSRFYISRLAYTICDSDTMRVGVNKFMQTIQDFSCFKHHYGFDYFTMYDVTSASVILKYYYIFITSYDYMYCLVLVCWCIYLWISIPVLVNFYKYNIYRNIVEHIIIVIKYLFLCGKEFHWIFIIFGLYVFYLTGQDVCSFILYIYNICVTYIFNFRMNSLDWICSSYIFNYVLDLYRLIHIIYVTPWGEVVDNSKYFWTGTSCIFYDGMEQLHDIFLIELTSLAYCYRCSTFSIVYSIDSSIFNMYTQFLGLYAWSTCVGIDEKFFSDYMVLNVYKLFESHGYYSSTPFDPFFSYGIKNQFILINAPNLDVDECIYCPPVRYLYIVGTKNNICSYIYGLSSTIHEKYYFSDNEKVFNYHMAYPFEHLFDYNCYYNSYTSTIHYSNM